MKMPLSVLALCAILSACQPAPFVSNASPSSDFENAGAEQCKVLEGTRRGTSMIEKAHPVERGDHLLGFAKRIMARIFLSGPLPDFSAPANFCQVTAKLRPVPGSEITAEVWLPQQWNGKMLGTGGGGFAGGLKVAAITLRDPVGKGYVGIATDAGHEGGSSAKFAHDFPQQYADYAYQANHVATGFAKALIASYYGKPVKRAYFQGCSNGGRDALMEARRFPDDYDGIISSAPATGWSKLMTSFAWNTQAALAAPDLKKKFKLLNSAVMAKCDALDGVADGLLENPANCPFDPAELQCKIGASEDCLSKNEVAALQKIYGGPRLRDGTQIYAGLPVGGEALKSNWEDWVDRDKSMQAMFARESFRWMVYGDPEWDVSRFDIDRDYPKAKERMGPIMDSDDPELSGFTGRGGKLLLNHGWNDAAIPAGATIDYYASLRKALGPVVDRQVRLFMVPGLMHCGGGVGPNSFDMLDELDRWVEGGAAPERILAKEYDPASIIGPAPGAKAVRTRPLCAWPKVARYNGSGSADDAANFSCR